MHLEKEIVFTAEEINSRIIPFQAPDNQNRIYPAYRLLPKNHPNIEGKYPYTELLLGKMTDMLPMDPISPISFDIADGFKLSKGSEMMFAYVLCKPHGKRHSIKYDSTLLRPDQELVFTWTIKCESCAQSLETDGHDEVNDEPLDEAEQLTPFGPLTELDFKFEQAKREILNVLENARALYSENEDPVRAARQQRVVLIGEIGQKYNALLGDDTPASSDDGETNASLELPADPPNILGLSGRAQLNMLRLQNDLNSRTESAQTSVPARQTRRNVRIQPYPA